MIFGFARVAGRANALILFALVVLGLGLAAPLAAEVAPSVLEELRVVTTDDDTATYVLQFSPVEPRTAAVNTNPSAPELVMATTVRAGAVDQKASSKGLVRAFRFEVSGASLVMRFETAAPARVRAERIGNRAVQVRVERASKEEALGSRPLGSAGEEVVPQQEAVRGPVDSYRPGDSFEMVMLKYADVSEVIGLLVEGAEIQPNDVFIRREPGFGSPGASQQNIYTGVQPQVQVSTTPLGKNVGQGLAIDRRLNAIWITGSPDRIEQVKRQIALIDVPVDSVILETQFVELSETGARNLGIDFANANGQIAAGTITSGANLPFGVNPRDVLPSFQLQAAISAQIQKGEGRIVSRPRIAAQSGATAKIITGDALPILTSIQLSGVNGVSQQVQYVNVGVTLQIAPRVSADGYITSKIYGVVSSVTGFSQGYPTISQREAETSASVRDGETFVIGGLTQENVLTKKSKIPVLGDIPLVGAAFRTDNSSVSKTELYIVITPRIVRHRRSAEVPSDESGPLPEAMTGPSVKDAGTP